MDDEIEKLTAEWNSAKAAAVAAATAANEAQDRLREAKAMHLAAKLSESGWVPGQTRGTVKLGRRVYQAVYSGVRPALRWGIQPEPIFLIVKKDGSVGVREIGGYVGDFTPDAAHD